MSSKRQYVLNEMHDGNKKISRMPSRIWTLDAISYKLQRFQKPQCSNVSSWLQEVNLQDWAHHTAVTCSDVTLFPKSICRDLR